MLASISPKCSPSYLQAMVLKPFVNREEGDPQRSAGRRTERQMAYYLDRHFREHARLHVLHDVQIEREGAAAQMDHVVVHGYGVADFEAFVGRYGPYGRCRSCSTNTPVRVSCDVCGERVRLQALPHGFEGVCEQCHRRFEVAFGTVGAR